MNFKGFKIRRKKLNPNYPDGVPSLTAAMQDNNVSNINYLWIKETPVAIVQLKRAILGRHSIGYKWDGFTWVVMRKDNYV